MKRRTFFFQSTAAGLAASRLMAADAASKKIRVAVIALGRGMGHVNALLKLPNVEIAYLAEVDPKRLELGLKTVAATQTTSCQGVGDFRRILEDSSVDAVFIAMPNFWHTPAALLAMQAGKHVYVEKPGSQNPHEAEMLVAASVKYNRLVQMGNQRRTWMKDAIAALQAGAIGKPRYGRAFYYNSRKAAGAGEKAHDPGLDLELWKGPVPDEPGRDIAKFVHYDWHWLWHWGNGELGNNGIHFLDILRWGLGVEYPERVTYNGGRYFFDDEQETPDTSSAIYHCGEVGMEWTSSSSHPRAAEKPLAECMFYGDGGTFAIQRDSWTVYDPKGVPISKGNGPGGGDEAHIGNFLDAIRGTAALNSPIAEGQKSTMLCHLGNLAYRTSTVVRCDPKTGQLIDNPAALKLWQRESYRPGWEPKI